MRASETLTREDHRLLDAASEWVIRLQTQPENERVVSEWLEWYSKPENRVAFDEMQRVQEDMRRLDEAARERLAERFVRSPAAAKIRSREWRLEWRAAFAASLVLVLATALITWNGGWFASEDVNGTYLTERGVRRTLSLADGSIVKLGADSSFSHNFTRETRYLVLERGEALFEIAKDSARPFIVQAGAVRIRAVGTEFNVRRAEGITFVSVKEGVVEIIRENYESRLPSEGKQAVPNAPVRLHAGEQAAATYSAASISVATISPDAVGSWQNGRLEFIDEPLPSVIATVNRYSRRDIVLTDPAAAAHLRFTGIVLEGRIELWVSAIQEVYPLKATTAGQGAILLSPSAS